MSFDLFKKIIDDLKEFDQPVKKIKIGNNGEPMLHKEFARMVEYIKKSKVTEIIEVFTNGSMLNPKLNKEIIDAGLDIINVSLQGLTSERYKEVAGIKINMEDMIRNIAHLYEVRKTCKLYVKVIDQTYALEVIVGNLYLPKTIENFFTIHSEISVTKFLSKRLLLSGQMLN